MSILAETFKNAGKKLIDFDWNVVGRLSSELRTAALVDNKGSKAFLIKSTLFPELGIYGCPCKSCAKCEYILTPKSEYEAVRLQSCEYTKEAYEELLGYKSFVADIDQMASTKAKFSPLDVVVGKFTPKGVNNLYSDVYVVIGTDVSRGHNVVSVASITEGRFVVEEHPELFFSKLCRFDDKLTDEMCLSCFDKAASDYYDALNSKQTKMMEAINKVDLFNHLSFGLAGSATQAPV